ncbi:XTP/dITP diphosphatase [Jeotgalibacillus soli]|uniref:dITP/XTP pyrophosphatase n=1 Tax=Jeotgalibacillus soli TaxID=889306 RepID=A0A0C2RS97_9BACL|nr:XTP/dITP diphosphatase [Jeotgalibacillus soli]KIL44619.1 deoxyribonucleotide triphosphate pyrophosphatase [Jeotgalibacillus soli]
MNTVLIATANKGKAREFETLFTPLGYQIKTLLDYPDAIDVEETGTTFEENAVLKAETISKQYNVMTIADDSGLIVDALNGEPGVYSARYAGEEKDDEANIDKVLEKLKDVPKDKRTAHFHCTLAVARPGDKTITVTGQCEGTITKERIGTNGFGYDPIFWVEDKKRTLAQLDQDEKNEISHRGNAIKLLAIMLPTLVK